MTTETKTKQIATINFQNDLWLLNAPGLGAEMGFWTLAAAQSFATNNLGMTTKLTNQAIVRSFKQ